LVSVAFLLIGATGIYLWFKIHTERTIGIILLSVNLVVSLALLTVMRS
jgi:hypothetical protein